MIAGRFKAVWLFSLLPLNSLAAESATPSSIGAMFQVFLALGLVVLAIFGAGWLLRRFGPAQMTQGGAMRVLGGVMVGPRERLVLVEVGETWLIVGVAPGNVSAVHSLPRPANVEASSQVEHPAFGAWLKEAWNKRQSGAS